MIGLLPSNKALNLCWWMVYPPSSGSESWVSYVIYITSSTSSRELLSQFSTCIVDEDDLPLALIIIPGLLFSQSPQKRITFSKDLYE